MPAIRYTLPFWRRREPPMDRDIAKLRPPSLPKGKRFETELDVKIESERSELLLRKAGSFGRRLANDLLSCREGSRSCDAPQCPICARSFRRWFTGDLLRITKKDSRRSVFITVLLEAASPGRIETLDFKKHRVSLRQKLIRAGLDKCVVIGGFEMVYKGKTTGWVLHVNLVVLHPNDASLEVFLESFDNSFFGRPTVRTDLVDHKEQLSYALKFTTYHRPHKQRGASKGVPVPLNADLHLELVKWMSERSFKDFIFLFNARLGKRSIKTDRKRGKFKPRLR